MSSHSVSRAPASFTEDGSRSSAACKINRRRVGPRRRETSPPPAPDRRSPRTPAPALGRVWSTSSWTGSRWGGPDAPRSPAAAEWTRSERTPEAGGWESGPCSCWPALSTARCWPWSGPSRPRRCPTRCAWGEDMQDEPPMPLLCSSDRYLSFFRGSTPLSSSHRDLPSNTFTSTTLTSSLGISAWRGTEAVSLGSKWLKTPFEFCT